MVPLNLDSSHKVSSRIFKSFILLFKLLTNRYGIYCISGSGINVPPPTSVDKNANLAPLADGEEDDGQYREDPSIYYKNDKFNSPPVKASQFSLSNSVRSSQPVYNQNHFASAQPAPVSQQNFNYQHQQQQPAFQYQQRNYQPQPQSNSFYQPQSYSHYQPEQFRGHPATNFDINTGSYSVSYTG